MRNIHQLLLSHKNVINSCVVKDPYSLKKESTIASFRRRGFFKKKKVRQFTTFLGEPKIEFEYYKARNGASKKNVQTSMNDSNVFVTASQIALCCLTTKTPGTGFQNLQELKFQFDLKNQVSSLPGSASDLSRPHHHHC